MVKREIIALTVRNDLHEIFITRRIICAGKYFPFNGLSSPVREAISHQVQNTVTATQQDLLNNIATLIDSRLTSFTNITHPQEEDSLTQITKMEETMTENDTFQKRETRTSIVMK